MILLDKEYYILLSNKLGLSFDFIVKEHILLDVLNYLQKLPFKYVLKGGTALNQVYFNQYQRFSEDLDLDIFENYSKDILQKHLRKIIPYDVKKYFHTKYIKGFEIGYPAFDKEDKVKIEFTNVNEFGNRGFLKNKIVYKTINSNLANIIIHNVPVYKLETLLVEKLIAIIQKQWKRYI